MTKDRLDEARKVINEADRVIAEAFEKRMKAAEIVADYKRERGLPILDTQREAEVIRRNSDYVISPEIREYYVKLCEELMAHSRAYQERLLSGMKVAYSGAPGAFAHIAAGRIFPTCELVSYKSFEEAYGAVVSGECDAAVLPIENSSFGEVGQVTDLMFSGPLYVNAVEEMEIVHDLLGAPGAALSDIKRVVSHPQALGQCAEYIREKGFSTEEYSNTAEAARYVLESGDKSLAAIASAEAAATLGLEVLERRVNTQSANTTRFAVFSRARRDYPAGKSGVHTVLLFTVRNEAGALAKAIDIIGKHGFNMRSLRSRPMKELLWEYYFYVEAEGNLASAEGASMLAELGDCCDRLKAVGSFVK